ncbi:isochorismatase family protein, partial [bacterium]|nr:isochorismatase family protein [candidate division CSSED10-310 bacterium]
TGMETHVCVLQTTADLIAAGFSVHVPSDVVVSRFKDDWQCGLDAMRQAGAIITGCEAAMFQLFREAGTSEFRYFSKLLKEISPSR